MSERTYTSWYAADQIIKISNLVRNGYCTSKTLAREMEMKPRTVNFYLQEMADRKLVHCISEANARAGVCAEWRAGPDQREIGTKPVQLREPARQVGMRRDSLIAALFGAPAVAA